MWPRFSKSRVAVGLPKRLRPAAEGLLRLQKYAFIPTRMGQTMFFMYFCRQYISIYYAYTTAFLFKKSHHGHDDRYRLVWLGWGSNHS